MTQTNPYNITVEQIKKLAGGVRDKSAARARKAFAKSVAVTEGIVDPQALRDRCKELVGVAPGWEALVELTGKVRALAAPTAKPVVKVDVNQLSEKRLADIETKIYQISKAVDDLAGLVMEHITKPDTKPTAPPSTEQI